MRKYILLICLLALPALCFAFGPAIQAVVSTRYAAAGNTNFTTDSDIVSYWLLQNNSNDGTANANHLTGSGSPTFVTSSPTPPKGYTYAAKFLEASSQYFSRTCADVSTGYPSKGSAPSAFTFTAWVYITGDAAGYNTIYSFSDTSANGHLVRIYKTGAGNGITFDAEGSYHANAGIATDEWHHIAYTWDGSVVRQYVDGAASGDTPSVTTPSSISSATCSGIYADLEIGSRRDGANFFDGFLAEVAVFKRALSAAEIQSIYDHRLDGSQ